MAASSSPDTSCSSTDVRVASGRRAIAGSSDVVRAPSVVRNCGVASSSRQYCAGQLRHRKRPASPANTCATTDIARAAARRILTDLGERAGTPPTPRRKADSASDAGLRPGSCGGKGTPGWRVRKTVYVNGHAPRSPGASNLPATEQFARRNRFPTRMSIGGPRYRSSDFPGMRRTIAGRVRWRRARGRALPAFWRRCTVIARMPGVVYQAWRSLRIALYSPAGLPASGTARMAARPRPPCALSRALRRVTERAMPRRPLPGLARMRIVHTRLRSASSA